MDSSRKDPRAVSQLDLSNLLPAEAANLLYKWLKKESEACGEDAEVEVRLQDPQTCFDCTGYTFWRVLWESGPEEWGVALSLGHSIYWVESGHRVFRPEVLLNGEHYWVEPYYSFDLMFRDD